MLAKHLQALADDKPIEIPEYCYKTHTRTKSTKTLKPTKIILVEGILLLQDPALREFFDIKVFMDTPLDIQTELNIKYSSSTAFSTWKNAFHEAHMTDQSYIDLVDDCKFMVNQWLSEEGLSHLDIAEEVTIRIKKCLRGNEVFGRLGGDEFAILITGMQLAHEAAHVAKRIIDVLHTPINIQGYPLECGISIVYCECLWLCCYFVVFSKFTFTYLSFRDYLNWCGNRLLLSCFGICG